MLYHKPKGGSGGLLRGWWVSSLTCVLLFFLFCGGAPRPLVFMVYKKSALLFLFLPC
jgi:hypothetical protein